MKKFVSMAGLTLLAALIASPALAAEGAEGASRVDYFSVCVFSAAIAMGFASAFAALGQGKAVAAAVDGIARQPNATGKIQVNLIIGLALIESLAIYTLVIALIILFANPFTALL